ncbi:MAG: maleylpyruvate isomerase N-terminal domain-containing protein [Streptosporangiaceae bacterium]
MLDPPSGATGLLAAAISYALGVCALIGLGEMTLPTPCADWDLGMLLGHLSDSMADLETAIRTGRLDLKRPARPPASSLAPGDPVEVLRDRAAQLLCTSYCYGGAERFVAVGGVPMPAGLVACAGAVEIAVHGWDVSAARAGAARAGAGCAGAGRGGVRPIPAALATRMLRLCPLLVVGREGLFAVPVEVPAQASPGDRLVGYLGRAPR